jgi:predicted DNA-binding protein
MTKNGSKTAPISIRFPVAIADRIEAEAHGLRRSKASIITEVMEKHFKLPPANPKPTKKAGSR